MAEKLDMQTTSIRLRPSVKEELQRISVSRNCSINSLINDLLSSVLQDKHKVITDNDSKIILLPY